MLEGSLKNQKLRINQSVSNLGTQVKINLDIPKEEVSSFRLQAQIPTAQPRNFESPKDYGLGQIIPTLEYTFSLHMKGCLVIATHLDLVENEKPSFIKHDFQSQGKYSVMERISTEAILRTQLRSRKDKINMMRNSNDQVCYLCLVRYGSEPLILRKTSEVLEEAGAMFQTSSPKERRITEITPIHDVSQEEIGDTVFVLATIKFIGDQNTTRRSRTGEVTNQTPATFMRNHNEDDLFKTQEVSRFEVVLHSQSLNTLSPEQDVLSAIKDEASNATHLLLTPLIQADLVPAIQPHFTESSLHSCIALFAIKTNQEELPRLLDISRLISLKQFEYRAQLDRQEIQFEGRNPPLLSQVTEPRVVLQGNVDPAFDPSGARMLPPVGAQESAPHSSSHLSMKIKSPTLDLQRGYYDDINGQIKQNGTPEPASNMLSAHSRNLAARQQVTAQILQTQGLEDYSGHMERLQSQLIYSKEVGQNIGIDQLIALRTSNESQPRVPIRLQNKASEEAKTISTHLLGPSGFRSRHLLVKGAQEDYAWPSKQASSTGQPLKRQFTAKQSGQMGKILSSVTSLMQSHSIEYGQNPGMNATGRLKNHGDTERHGASSHQSGKDSTGLARHSSLKTADNNSIHGMKPTFLDQPSEPSHGGCIANPSIHAISRQISHQQSIKSMQSRLSPKQQQRNSTKLSRGGSSGIEKEEVKMVRMEDMIAQQKPIEYGANMHSWRLNPLEISTFRNASNQDSLVRHQNQAIQANIHSSPNSFSKDHRYGFSPSSQALRSLSQLAGNASAKSFQLQKFRQSVTSKAIDTVNLRKIQQFIVSFNLKNMHKLQISGFYQDQLKNPMGRLKSASSQNHKCSVQCCQKIRIEQLPTASELNQELTCSINSELLESIYHFFRMHNLKMWQSYPPQMDADFMEFLQLLKIYQPYKRGNTPNRLVSKQRPKSQLRGQSAKPFRKQNQPQIEFDYASNEKNEVNPFKAAIEVLDHQNRRNSVLNEPTKIKAQITIPHPVRQQKISIGSTDIPASQLVDSIMLHHNSELTHHVKNSSQPANEYSELEIHHIDLPMDSSFSPDFNREIQTNQQILLNIQSCQKLEILHRESKSNSIVEIKSTITRNNDGINADIGHSLDHELDPTNEPIGFIDGPASLINKLGEIDETAILEELPQIQKLKQTYRNRQQSSLKLMQNDTSELSVISPLIQSRPLTGKAQHVQHVHDAYPGLIVHQKAKWVPICFKCTLFIMSFIQLSENK